jgi:hypothetical protein
MKKKMRVMTEKPLNAETPIESLRTWTKAQSGPDDAKADQAFIVEAEH